MTSIENNKAFKLSTFFFLYLAQAVPMSFFTTALQVIMREQHFSLSTIGMLQLIKLPWILKLFWSPMIDRYSTTVNHYKRWIIGSEVVYAVLIFLTGILDLAVYIYLVIILVLLSLIASATQDIATDALAILSSNKQEKGLLNSMQSMGSFGGSLLGSGLLLMILHQYGWNRVTQCLSAFVLVATLPLLLNRKLTLKRNKDVSKKARWSDFVWFFTRKGIWPQIGFLVLYYTGIIGVMSTLKPYMVDLGYTMKEIGFISGIVGIGTAFIVSFPAGMLVRRYGYQHMRIIYACVMVLATGSFMIISMGTPTKFALIAAIMLLWSSYGMGTVVVYTSAMNHVREGREGTDFTIQTVITHLMGIVIAIFSGLIADRWGYTSMFTLQTGLSLLSLLYVVFVLRKKKGE